MTGSLCLEEPVHTSWSIFCNVNHWASASNYQLSNMKRPGRDSNWRPQMLKVITVTTTLHHRVPRSPTQPSIYTKNEL